MNEIFKYLHQAIIYHVGRCFVSKFIQFSMQRECEFILGNTGDIFQEFYIFLITYSGCVCIYIHYYNYPLLHLYQLLLRQWKKGMSPTNPFSIWIRILLMAFSFPSVNRTSSTSAEIATWKGGGEERAQQTMSKYACLCGSEDRSDKPSVSCFLTYFSVTVFNLFSFYVCIILIIQSNQSILLSFHLREPLSCYHSVP